MRGESGKGKGEGGGGGGGGREQRRGERGGEGTIGLLSNACS